MHGQLTDPPFYFLFSEVTASSQTMRGFRKHTKLAMFALLHYC